MNLSDILFGSEGELQSQTLSTLTPEQESVMQQLLRGLGGGNISSPGADFLGPGEQMSLAALEERSMNRATDQVPGESRGALLDLIKNRGAPNDFNDFFNTNIEKPAVESFNKDVLPQIGRDFGGSSFFGSERMNADESAKKNLIDSLTRSRSELAFKERGDSQNRLLQAIGLAPQVDASETDTLLKELEGLGTGRRAKDDRISQLLAALSVRGRENLGGMTSGTTGLVQSFVGGFGQGLGDAMGGSDRRLKTNITHIGQTISGVPVYRFNYIGEHQSHVGVMADEVEHIPGAVIELQGVKFVDYRKVI